MLDVISSQYLSENTIDNDSDDDSNSNDIKWIGGKLEVHCAYT